MIKETIFIESNTFDPTLNLALEEYLLDNLKEFQCILYLWQNENTIVIGKNQNAYKECDVDAFLKQGGKVVRRLSGGGAVFHDLGNLNFTFLLNQEDYDVHRQLTVIQKALQTLHIDVSISGRNDLTVEDRKISGNAFYKKGKACYHHGTVLVDTDKSKMQMYLKPSLLKLKSKGVDSVKSRTANCIEFNSELKISDLKQAIKNVFEEEYGKSSVKQLNDEELEVIQLKSTKYNEQFNLNRIPFTVQTNQRFKWGEITLSLFIKNGLIEEIQIDTDAMEVELFEKIRLQLKGIPFKKEIIKEKILEDKECLEIKKDILTCFNWEEDHGTV